MIIFRHRESKIIHMADHMVGVKAKMMVMIMIFMPTHIFIRITQFLKKKKEKKRCQYDNYM